jgi:hypothetical protein
MRGVTCPTIPMAFCRGSNDSLSPSPRMCEWAPILSIRVTSLTSATFGAATCIEIFLKCYKISYKVAFAGTFRRCFGLRFLLFSIVCCRSMKEDKFTDSSIEIRMTTKQLEKIYKFSRQGCYSRATQNLKTSRNASTSSPIRMAKSTSSPSSGRWGCWDSARQSF